MNIHYIFNLKKVGVSLVLLSFLFSCSNDDNQSGDPYFMIEENPTGISVDFNEISKSYVVRANGSWQIVAQDSSDWVRPFPAEGEDDGIFKILLNENDTFEARTTNFAFILNGQEQPTLFRVEQEGNIPSIEIENADVGIAVPSAEGEFSVYVKSNLDWTYSLDDDSWLTEKRLSTKEIKFSVPKNTGSARTAVLTVHSAQYPELDKTVTVRQSSGSIILEEDFSWLNYANAIFYETSGEKRMDLWTAEEKAKGWTSTENAESSNQQLVYARTGFVKLGKTSYGGDLISPPLSELDEPTDVRVVFKAVPYQTKKGTRDDNTLNISVIGPGQVSVNSFTIDNWPDYDVDPENVIAWQSEDATYEFVITGATSETRIKFLGGDYDLKNVGAGKNRVFLDDIKVVIIE